MVRIILQRLENVKEAGTAVQKMSAIAVI